MKRSIFLLIALAVPSWALVASAYDGILATDNSPMYVQNVKGTKPVAAAASCTTVTAMTKGTIATVSATDTAGKAYLLLDWSVTDASGSLVVVKRYLNNNTAYMPQSSGQVVVGRGSDVTSVHFDLYSSATPKTVTLCTDRQ